MQRQNRGRPSDTDSEILKQVTENKTLELSLETIEKYERHTVER
jgi:hypothetical protein